MIQDVFLKFLLILLGAVIYYLIGVAILFAIDENGEIFKWLESADEPRFKGKPEIALFPDAEITVLGVMVRLLFPIVMMTIVIYLIRKRM